MSAIIYLEGGGDSKDLHVLCRCGFRKLLENCGFKGRMPRLVACGGRNATFEAFKTAHSLEKSSVYVAMIIDSEDPLVNFEEVWKHLKYRDLWDQPTGTVEDQVLLMTTCMETWIVADQERLESHYGRQLQKSALPSLVNLEKQSRHDIQNKLSYATRNCSNAYEKGKRSFEILSKLSPVELEKHLSSFSRMKRILDARL